MPVRAKSKATRRKPGRRVYRRKTRVPRRLQLVHNFQRDRQFPILNPAWVDPLLERQWFSLDMLPDVTDFTNLYDEYKINSVTVMWRLDIDPGAQPAAQATYPRLTTYKDYNDTNPPANIDEVRSRQAKQISTLYPGKTVIRKIRPALQTAILKSPSGVTINAPKWNTWLPCTITDVQHLGFKFMIERFTTTTYTISALYRFNISCRHVR